MRSMSRVLGAVLCVVFVITAMPVSAGVEWSEATYTDIINKAKTENKHVFIDFYTTWCGPCKQLDEVTYKDEKVVQFLNGIIPVKLDAEKGEGETLAKKFKIGAYPTLILLGPDGKEIDRHLGYLDAEKFVEVMDGYKNGIGTVAYYETKVKENPKDAESWKILGTKYADAARAKDAKKALNTYLELTPDASGDDKAEVLYTLADANYKAKSYEESIKIYKKMAVEFEGTEWHDRALVMSAYTYNKMDKKDMAADSYIAYVNRHPDDPTAMNSFAWFAASKGVAMDKALPYAEKAAELSNREPGILDTLAELHYAMGNYDKAIEVGKEALTKDPEDEYLADQLKKFETAKKEGKAQVMK